MWKWLVVAVVVAIAFPIVWRLLFPGAVSGPFWAYPLSAYLDSFIVTFTRYSVWEEIAYRGIAWGFSRRLGLNDRNCLLLTTGLWWAIHAWQLTPLRWGPAIFFVFIPLMGLLLGFLTWRSKSMVPAMVAHALINTIMLG